MSTLSELYKGFRSDLLARGRALATTVAYEQDVKVLADFLGADDLRKVRPERLADLPRWLNTRKNAKGRIDSPRTIARRLASLSAFCDFLVRMGNLQANPFKGIPRPHRPKRLPRAIPVQWIDAILGLDLTPLERGVVTLLRYSGVRVSEIENLAVGDLDLLEDGGLLVVRSGKGGKDRAIPLDPEALPGLQAWLVERGEVGVDEALFVQDSRRVTKKVVRSMLRRLARRAGVPSFTPHQVRHTFITEAARSQTMIAKELQAIAGHASADTTNLYISVTGSDLRAAINNLSAWRRQQKKP